jgi:hypothetical protein
MKFVFIVLTALSKHEWTRTCQNEPTYTDRPLGWLDMRDGIFGRPRLFLALAIDPTRAP